MSPLAALFVSFVIVPTTIWVALVVHYHVRGAWLRWLVTCLPIAIVAASVAILPLVPWALVAWVVVLVTAFAWWLSLRPRADRDWMEGMKVLPRVEIVGDRLHIKQFRNFSYSETGEPTPRYEERTYDLSQVSSLDYLLAHWSGPVIAHTLVSFGFDDGQFLAVSVEARREPWQRYSPLAGLLRSYELIFVLGDERDIVRLRTNVWRNRVYMYRVRMPREEVRGLLVDYLTRVEMLANRPEWYNSVISNCTTNLFYHGRHRVPWWLTPDIFLNGMSARAMYRRGFVDTSVPYKELKARCAIRERALAAGDSADFSQRIREPVILPEV